MFLSTDLGQTEAMVPDPPADVWIGPHLRVGRSSICGRGLFTRQPIVAGQVVWRLGGRLVDTAELDALIRDANAKGHYVDTITVFEGAHLVLPDHSIVHFANHSCDPNLWHDGPYEVAARRNIAAGEELTIDYGTNSGAPGFEMTCVCNSPDCRGMVSSEDWRIDALQRRYETHWVPALAARINNTRTDQGGK